jgi:hypothetical protein
MLSTPAQARFDNSGITATMNAGEDDDLVAGHAEPKRVLEPAKKNPSVPAVEIRIHERVRDDSGNRLIEGRAKFEGKALTLRLQPVFD